MGKRGRSSKKATSTELNLSNQFDLLTDDETEPSSAQNLNKISRPNGKKSKVPPVVVKPTNFQTLRKDLLTENSNSKHQYNFQIGRRGECRVQAETMEGFEKLKIMLSKKEYQYFTYDTKDDRLFKVVLKGLPSGESLDDINNELAQLLAPIVPVNIIKMKMKSRPGDSRHGISNDYYLVHFKSSELNNLKALEKASIILQVRVRWEHFRKTGGNFQNLTQCRRCQSWGHGTRNCHMHAKCMICGSLEHSKDSCTLKDNPTKFKCSNCGENHKSNYWECKTRKAVLESRVKRKVGNVRSSRPGINPSAANKDQRGKHSPSVPVGTNRTSSTKPTSYVQQVNGTYADIAAGRTFNGNFPTGNSNGIVEDSDTITEEKMNFLNMSIRDMIFEMMNANTMRDALSISLSYASKIVHKLRFNNVN
jgi:hypothetical protein